MAREKIKDIFSWLKKRKIAVLYGGFSEEKEISHRTGQAVLRSFRGMNLDAVGIEVDHSVPELLRKLDIGFCFIALHGKWGEDGTMQGLCEIMGIPYSGSGVLASAMSMNKAVSKMIFQNSGISTAPFELLNKNQKSSLPVPLVIKPLDGGSAIGVSIVRKKSEISSALKSALRYSRQALVEKFIDGKEVTAPVLGDRVLPLIEIIPRSSFYDFRSKYVKGMSEHILPARVSEKIKKEICSSALKAHHALRCRAFSRVDFIIDKNGKSWVLELNSIPGMTETSLFPESAKAAGFSFSEMLLEIIRHSILDHGLK